MAKRIALLYICTGKYDVFWDSFYASAQKYLLLNHVKHYFVFTDSERLLGLSQPGVTVVRQPKLGWPYDTLKRFEIFKSVYPDLSSYDFVYYFNANLEMVGPVGDEILPEADEQVVVCLHPGYVNTPPDELPYDRNKKSLAYIPKGSGARYFAGGLNGGTYNSYGKLIAALCKATDDDLANNVVARWHDESHLNKYVLSRHDLKVLSPSYLFPEGGSIPFEPKVIIKDKKKYGGHDYLRGATTGKKRCLRKFRDLLHQKIKKILGR